jgi:hypothetical protein
MWGSKEATSFLEWSYTSHMAKMPPKSLIWAASSELGQTIYSESLGEMAEEEGQ